MANLDFKIEAKASGSSARAATFRTSHNEVQTPVFMPVGTHATVRGVPFSTLEDLEFPVLLANTYHLMLRPGPEVFDRIGGLHKFADWGRSFLTDSGGFQIFSLPNSVSITEDGARFRSYVKGEIVELTPERSMEMQRCLGSDIAMVLDHCIPSDSDRELAQAAMDRTHRWALRSLEARHKPQGVFAIAQGACFPDLRKESASYLSQFPFDGFAIGGLGLGESKDKRSETIANSTDYLPEDKPRYLMGVGTPIDILEGVHRGVDMFDCILPTALAQQGVAFTSRGKIDFKRGVHRFSEMALDPKCSCVACSRYSRAYLHHLVKAKEGLGWNLLSTHNLTFYRNLMREMRKQILQGTFEDFYQVQREELQWIDLDNPITKPTVRRRKQKVTTLGEYRVKEVWTGHHSVEHVPSGETMHATNQPDEEAQLLYIDQSKLELLLQQEGKPLVIWDVGLGPAHNAMATIRCYEETAEKSPCRNVQLVSFESDMDSLRLAMKNPGIFHHLRHSGPSSLIKTGSWSSKDGGLRWEIHEGDFLNEFKNAPVPDIIFYDPFSYKTNDRLWNLECFQQIMDYCSSHETELFTYTNSTAIRATLLAAGFYVAMGSATGLKTETTIAMTPKASKSEKFDLLGDKWLQRWERSHRKVPECVETKDHLNFENQIRNHAQFQ